MDNQLIELEALKAEMMATLFILSIDRHDAIKQIVDRIRALKTESENNKVDHLDNLLARIHRDGGHYVGKYGYDKAVEDAHKIISKLYNLDEPAGEFTEEDVIQAICSYVFVYEQQVPTDDQEKDMKAVITKLREEKRGKA